MRFHLASSPVSALPISAYSSKKIDGEWPNTFQASSAVNERKGAIQRSIACVRCHSVVCAARRAGDLGAVV